jgi:hypothetical protein
MSREHIWSLVEGQLFKRARKFWWARDKWWLGEHPPMDIEWAVEAGREPPCTCADGQERIEVVEIAETRALGLVAVYRQWVTNPDGDDVALPWTPTRSKLLLRAESRLRGTLNGGGYHEVRQQPKPPKRKLRLIVGDDALH